jgi:tetratricopeptide (TPR) repeat protein
MDADLPSPVQQHGRGDPRAGRPGSEHAIALGDPDDLPSVMGSRGAAPVRHSAPDYGEIDLPSPGASGLPVLADRDVGLPVPAAALPGLVDSELPSLGGVGLPSVGAAALPALAGTNLPTLEGGSLPVRAEGAPQPPQRGNKFDSDPPLPGALGFGAPGFSAPSVGAGTLPFGDAARVPTPPPAAGKSGREMELPPVPGLDVPSLPPLTERSAMASLGDLAFGSAPSARTGRGVTEGSAITDLDGFGELELPLHSAPPPPTAHSAGLDPFAASLPGSAAAPTMPGAVSRPGDYGEVDLDAGGADLSVATENPLRRAADEDMEFGAIPQESSRPRAAPTEAQPVAPRPAKATERATPQRAPSSRRFATRAALGLVAALVVGGAALALVPSIGPFGIYALQDWLGGGEQRALLERRIQETRELLARDDYPAARRALTELQRASATSRRLEELTTYMAYVTYLESLRFGADGESEARAKVALDELEKDAEILRLDLARAAREAAAGSPERAAPLLTALDASGADGLDVLILRGEFALKTKNTKDAAKLWGEAATRESSARTAFGLARAELLVGAAARAKAQGELTLKRNPNHAGARVLLARMAWRDDSDEKRAVALLQPLAPRAASPAELLDAHALLGDIHLERQRFSKAQAEYNQALKLRPKAAGAQRGLGEMYYQAGRYSEALAHFEASSKAEPDDTASAIGVAKSLVALERVPEAKPILENLDKAHPKNPQVALWVGRLLEATGKREPAEAAYRRAVANAGGSPRAIGAYVALSSLLLGKGQADEAAQLLERAKTELRKSSSVLRALGELYVAQGRYDAAQAELKAALAVEPQDLGARFELGVAQRRARAFDAALATFDEVQSADREYPGLALERGLLHEAAGRTEEALKSYEGALKAAPNDLDLMLRVGCSKVAAGNSEDAEKLLKRVLAQRGTSAETNHCYGRALLSKGADLTEALRALKRAADLDPHRAEYHLYVGWASLEAGRLPDADRELGRALELDQGLADAYWQRGILRYRQGAVKDAVTDLKKALELRPSRFEAHAALADSYYDLGNEAAALAEWNLAIQADPDNVRWRFRYGKLLADRHESAAALPHLTRAVELGEKQSPKPRWLWEGHLLLARVLGPRPEAAAHWEAFLKDAPQESPYRDEATRALRQLGKTAD